jgi:hypothetical protein
VDIDAVRARLPDHPHHVGPATGQLLPPVAPAGPDHDLGDLMLLGETGDGPGRVVVLQLVPAGPDVRRQLLELLDRRTVPGARPVAGGDVDHVEFAFEPGGHPGRPPQQGVGPGGRGDGHHDALTGLPHDAGFVPPQVLKEFVVRLVGEEPQRQLPQGGQVVGAEEVGQGLGDLGLRVDVAVQHSAAELLR